jgi:dTDP-4-amino-4,6-dideoxygalactose transaminase
MRFRQQLPAYSPVSAKAALLASAQALHLGADPRPALRALLEKEYDATSVVLCGSGTQALTLAIREAQRRADPKAPVALPAFSCFDVASAAIGANARVSLYDLDPNTLGPDMESLERVLKAGAGVVVIAPLYGIPVDWDALKELAGRYGSVLIEDAAQGHGASWNGKRLGALGEISVLSFGRGKGWTGGRGGALLMRGAEGSARRDVPEPTTSECSAVALADIAQWAFARPAVYGIPAAIPALRLGETTYRESRPVTSMTRSAAASLLATHEAALVEAGVRRRNAARFVAGLGDNSRARTIRTQHLSCAGYLRLPVRLPNGIGSLKLGREASQLGIFSSYPMSLSNLSQLAGRLVDRLGSPPGAETLVRQLVTVPTHSRLGPNDLSEVAGILTP